MKQLGNPLSKRATAPLSTNPIFLRNFFLTPFLSNFQKRDTHSNISTRGEEETMFTCIRIKLSCTFYRCSPIKSKIGGKILFPKTCQNKLLSPIFNLVKFLLRPKNECVALIAFKLSAASNTPENPWHDLSTSLIQLDNLIDWSLKNNLGSDS